MSVVFREKGGAFAFLSQFEEIARFIQGFGTIGAAGSSVSRLTKAHL